MEKLIPTLLVEDEKIILDDILTIVDYEALGFEIVATAMNGRQALTLYDEFHPKLIITDIQMPFMDGLSMMREIRKEDKDVAFLILSGYSEFEYAKEAVRLGTDAYLLKAEISSELMTEVLSPIRSRITSRSQMEEVTARHNLFSLISMNIEFDTEEKLSDQAILTAYESMLSSSDLEKDWISRLYWVIKECYSLLASTAECKPIPKDQNQISGWLLEEYHNLWNLKHFISIKHYSPMIINACRYIQENYSDPTLKISTVADHVGLSSSRLSVLFKQETGQTVNDYITDTRIDKAKELLRSGRYKVYEVSDVVGYKTSQYFSQIFVQRTGKSPTDYLKGQ